MNNKLFFKAYIIALHILLLAVFFSSNFPQRIAYKLGYIDAIPELTSHYFEMLKYHQGMDINVPKDANIFIGDSTVQSLVLAEVAPLSINYGIGSDTTLGVIQRLGSYQSIERAKTIVLAIGINDLKRRDNIEIMDNYKIILNKMIGHAPVLISAILPVNEKFTAEYADNNRIQNINAQLLDLSKASDRFYFLDIADKLVNAEGQLSDQFHTGDGVHLNRMGYSVWIAALRAKLLSIPASM